MKNARPLFISLLAVASVASPARADVVSEPPLAGSRSEGPAASQTAPLDEELLAPAGDRAHLDEWLVYLSAGARRSRLTTGAELLVVSGVVMGTGIWAYLQSNPTDELTRGAGLAAIGGSGVLMASAISQLAVKSPAEKTLLRWRAVDLDQLTIHELARFEGELRQYTEMAKRSLRVGRWLSFGVAMTGALIVGLTPAADLSSNGATTGYVTGGVALGVGLLGFGLSFVGRSKTDYWNAYLQGKRPPPSRWSAVPQVSPTLAGLRLTGRF